MPILMVVMVVMNVGAWSTSGSLAALVAITIVAAGLALWREPGP